MQRVFPIFDAHVDSLQLALDLGADLGTSAPGQLDLPRARRAGLSAVVLVAWADPAGEATLRQGPRARSAALLGEFHALLARHPETLTWAGNAHDLAAAQATGRTALIAGIEGGHSLEESLAALEWFFERGLRVLTLVWNNHLPWIRSCRDGAGPEVPPGLSSFGREVVQKLNELGVLIDLSHAGERSFYDTLEHSRQPVIASHSGCSKLHEHPRNLSDAQLRALAQAQGVIGIVFCPAFLDASARLAEQEVYAQPVWKTITGRNETETFLLHGRHMQRTAAPLSLERVLDHIVHAAEIAGVDCVGLGSDYDGILRAPVGLEDASGYQNLFAGLQQRGFHESEIEAIAYGNMQRAFATATGPGTRAAQAVLAPLLC